MTMHLARHSRIISVTSGKGGVGKTSIAVNIATALARMGRRTLLADCDFGMANAAMLLGLTPQVTIDDVLNGRLSVDETITEGPEGLMFLAGSGGGIGKIPELGSDALNRLGQGLRPYARITDFIIVDTPTGVAPSTLAMASAADSILLVVTDEPTAFMDAYATLKLLALDHHCKRFGIITNMIETEQSGRALFARLREIVARFLPVELDYIGGVPMDRHMRDAVVHKRCCVEAYSHSPAAMALSRIAAKLSDMKIPNGFGGDRFLGREAPNVLR